MEENNEKIEAFAKHESTEVNIVPGNGNNKYLVLICCFYLLLIFFLKKSTSLSFFSSWSSINLKQNGWC